MLSTMRSESSVPMRKEIVGDKIMEHIDRSVKSKPEIRPPVSSWRLVAITFTLSAVMLAYEILLTRIASVLLTNQYVFLIVGVSLLGIAIGAVVEYFYSRKQLGSPARDNFPVVGIVLTVLALVAAIILILKIGPTQGKTVVALSAALPFAASGFVFSRLFRLRSRVSFMPLIYLARPLVRCFFRLSLTGRDPSRPFYCLHLFSL